MGCVAMKNNDGDERKKKTLKDANTREYVRRDEDC